MNVHARCVYGSEEQIINFLKIYGLLQKIKENQNHFFFDFLFNVIGFKFLRQKILKMYHLVGNYKSNEFTLLQFFNKTDIYCENQLI